MASKVEVFWKMSKSNCIATDGKVNPRSCGRSNDEQLLQKIRRGRNFRCERSNGEGGLPREGSVHWVVPHVSHSFYTGRIFEPKIKKNTKRIPRTTNTHTHTQKMWEIKFQLLIFKWKYDELSEQGYTSLPRRYQKSDGLQDPRNNF